MTRWLSRSRRLHASRPRTRAGYASHVSQAPSRHSLEILEPRLLLSGSISAQFVAVDNSAVLTGYNTFDLEVTTTSDWTAAVMRLNLTNGTIYQDPSGSSVALNPLIYTIVPSLEFDTFLGGGVALPSIAGAAGDLGGDALQFDAGELDVSWFNVGANDIGTLGIARITLSDDAAGTWSYLAINAAGERVTDSGTVTAGSFATPTPPPPAAPAVDGDFTGDGKTDILWRNRTTGQTSFWQMDGTAFQASTDLTSATTDTNWRPVGVGDFTGDGETDTLWRNAVDGRNYIAQTSNGVSGQQFNLTTVGNLDWKIAGVADFTGDAKNDILWRNTRNGRNLVWQMDGITYQQKLNVKRMRNTSWRIGGTADFNGDGKADILWRNTTNGRNAVWQMNGAAFQGSTAIKRVRNQAWQIAQVGDYTGDGLADILWRNTANGANTVWQMNGTAFQAANAIQSQPDQDWQAAGPLLGLWEA